MYESLTESLVRQEGRGMVGLFFGQYLTSIAGPALIVLGLGVWNPFLFLGGLLSVRLLFLFSDLQKDVADRIVASEQGGCDSGGDPRHHSD